MKLKNVTFLERHIEKLLIALTLLILVGVGYFYGLRGTTVTIDGQTMEPKDIDPHLEIKARRLADALNSKQLPPELKLAVPEYAQAFAQKLDEQLMPGLVAPLALAQVPLIPGGDEETKDLPYYTPTVPAPELVAARADLGTVDPQEVQSNPDLAKFLQDVKHLPQGGPFDMDWVSVVGRFNMQAMVEQLMKNPGGNIQPIPTDWWLGKFGVLDVQLQREEYDEARHKWSEPTMVDPFPGSLTFRYINTVDEVKPEEAAYWLDVMRNNQRVIQQLPIPVVLAGGKTWTPPENDEPVNANADAKEALRTEIKHLHQQMTVIQRQIDRYRTPGPGRSRTPQFRPGRSATPAGLPERGGIGGEAFPGAPAANRRGRAAATPKVPHDRLSMLTQRLQDLTIKVQKLEADYIKLTGESATPANPANPGFPNPGTPGGPGFESGGPGGPFPGVTRPGYPPVATPPIAAPTGPVTADAQGQLSPDNVKRIVDSLGGAQADLWAHDFTVKPGKTYRYRIRVVLPNPLFHKPTLQGEQKKQNLNKFTLTSDWTDWGKPVTTQDTEHFFIASASPNGQARVEVWKFADNNWRVHEFPVRAGDPVGGPESVKVNNEDAIIDFSTGVYVVDMDTLTLPGKMVGLTSRTTRVLFLVDNHVIPRRLDQDRNDDQRAWLKRQLEDQALLQKISGNPGNPTAPGAFPGYPPAAPGASGANPFP